MPLGQNNVYVKEAYLEGYILVSLSFIPPHPLSFSSLLFAMSHLPKGTWYHVDLGTLPLFLAVPVDTASRLVSSDVLTRWANHSACLGFMWIPGRKGLSFLQD